MILAEACPPGIQTAAAPPPRPKYTRYADAGLQTAYSYVVAGLRGLTIPIYGAVFSEEVSDTTARHLIDAVRSLPGSADMQQRIRCSVEPPVKKLLVGVYVLGAAALGLSIWALAKRRR